MDAQIKYKEGKCHALQMSCLIDYLKSNSSNTK